MQLLVPFCRLVAKCFNVDVCVFILFSEALEVNETAPKISASIKRSLTTIQVKWDPSIIIGVKGDIKGFELVYELVKVNGKPSDNPVSTRIVICSNYTEYLLKELTPFAEYKIKIAAFTLEGPGKFSNAVYGGRNFMSSLMEIQQCLL